MTSTTWKYKWKTFKTTANIPRTDCQGLKANPKMLKLVSKHSKEETFAFQEKKTRRTT